MSSTTQYRCEENVVTLLESAKLSLNGLRFVHATYHHLDNHPGWTPSHMSLKPTMTDSRICTVLAAELCATTGTPGANDISMIRKGIEDVEGRNLFQHLELDRRKVRFRYSKQMAEATQHFKNAKFAILDCDEIARLRSPWDVLFYTRASMVTRQDWPVFSLPRICPVSEPWKETKRTWLAAACRVGERLNQHYVVIPELDAKREHVTGVRVKIVHGRSKWSKGKIFPRYAIEPVCVVAHGKAETLSREKLRHRRDWSKATGP